MFFQVCFSVLKSLYSLLGEVISEKDRCSACRGKKVVNETKILDVHIDKGMREGQKIYFRGEGDQQVNIMEFENSNILHFISPLWFQSTDRLHIVQITVLGHVCSFCFTSMDHHKIQLFVSLTCMSPTEFL